MSVRRIVSAVALAAGAASPAMAAVAYLPCADFISSRVNDRPVAGELMGWAEITTTVYVNGHPHPSKTHYEGYYQTDEGIIRVDCETYEQIV